VGFDTSANASSNASTRVAAVELPPQELVDDRGPAERDLADASTSFEGPN